MDMPLAYVLAYVSSNLGVRMRTDILFVLFSSYFFPLGKVTFVIYAKAVPKIPIKHI